MNAYSSLAKFYDSLTRDVPYGKIADYIVETFRRAGLEVKTILDLACGTGSLTYLLANRGYDMIGVDASAEMLMIAADKSGLEANRPLLLNQSLEDLDLYGTVDAAICSLDGINYIRPESVGDVFRRVCIFLEPGGMFIFDIHTPSKLKSFDGEVFLDETDDVYCIWRAEFDANVNACRYGMDIFERDGRKWLRSREEHVEYAYDPCDITKLLISAGFEDVHLYGDMTYDGPTASDQRLYITASKPK